MYTFHEWIGIPHESTTKTTPPGSVSLGSAPWAIGAHKFGCLAPLDLGLLGFRFAQLQMSWIHFFGAPKNLDPDFYFWSFSFSVFRVLQLLKLLFFWIEYFILLVCLGGRNDNKANNQLTVHSNHFWMSLHQVKQRYLKISNHPIFIEENMSKRDKISSIPKIHHLFGCLLSSWGLLVPCSCLSRPSARLSPHLGGTAEKLLQR